VKLTGEEAQSIVWDDHEDWMEIETEIEDTTRWSIVKQSIYKHTPTGKHYRFNYSVGATECQDEQPYKYEPEVEVQQVRKVPVTKIVWEDVG
jgi:hypothetical protein